MKHDEVNRKIRSLPPLNNISQDFCVTDRVDALAGMEACLSFCEITEDLKGVSGAALVWINPVLSCRQ